MGGFAMLVQDGQGYRFASETALEDFVAKHLKPLWGFDLVARQFQVDGEICDVLAADVSRRPIIIELKNTEDRYVVQQVTRYSHALTTAKPFPDRIDWSLPPGLIILGPSFHRHNLIDREHCTLPIQFKAFKVLNSAEGFTLAISTLDETARWHHPIPFKPLAAAPRDVPKELVDWLGYLPAKARNAVLRLRGKLLQQSGISENVEKGLVFYGNKKRRAVEICFHKAIQQPVLFCWIPTFMSMRGPKPLVRRHRLWIGENHQPEFVGHVPEGFGKMKTQKEWDQIPRQRWPVKYLRNHLSHTSHFPTPFTAFRLGFFDSTPGVSKKLDSWSVLSELIVESWASTSTQLAAKPQKSG
jgi:hypothetical protein